MSDIQKNGPSEGVRRARWVEGHTFVNLSTANLFTLPTFREKWEIQVATTNALLAYAIANFTLASAARHRKELLKIIPAITAEYGLRHLKMSRCASTRKGIERPRQHAHDKRNGTSSAPNTAHPHHAFQFLSSRARTFKPKPSTHTNIRARQKESDRNLKIKSADINPLRFSQQPPQNVQAAPRTREDTCGERLPSRF